MIDRRSTLKLMGTAAAVAATTTAAPRAFAAAAGEGIQWTVTRDGAPWQAASGLAMEPPPANMLMRDVTIDLAATKQTMTGIGGAFGELGWLALKALPQAARDEAMAALFADSGAAFNHCRTPIGANDIARKWYSYDETDGDFALKNFSVANDRETLIPYINAAQKLRPDLKVWASPWSPPTWMKKNRHYAMAPAWPGQPSNGIAPEQLGREGADFFIQEDRYFEAYARYFRRYVEEYGKAGIPISTVMPQNEFNSAQPFPSCCWTPEGLARFIPHLGREMGQIGVDVMFGTLERGNVDLLAKVMAVPEAAKVIQGVGVQWAGKNALESIAHDFPGMTIWGSEQECGRGTNDWHYTRYIWGVMKRYFNAGASTWHYWNMAMPLGGMSSWGWPQNALVSIDVKAGTYSLTSDYWLLRHLSAHVKVGAKFLPAPSFLGYDNQLAFRNPNGDVVIVAQNDMATPLKVSIMIGDKHIAPVLPADSFSTIVVPAAML